jgi:hypothetical protein
MGKRERERVTIIDDAPLSGGLGDLPGTERADLAGAYESSKQRRLGDSHDADEGYS